MPSDAHMPNFPKVDMDALMAIQKANIETFSAAQKIIFDLAQTVAQRQAEMMKESFARSEAMMKSFDGKKEPQAYVDEARVAVEKAMAEIKETMDLSMKAQNEVVDLFVKRAQANFDEARKTSA